MRLLGIFGHPISHSLSPKMQNAAIRAAGLEKKYVYVPFDVFPEGVASAVKSLRILGARGVNVTIPHKEEVIPYLDELDTQAQAVQAVNVIVNENKRLVGYNTDGIGFIRSLKDDAGIDPKEKKVLVLGAGGAAKSVSAALAAAGAKDLVIVNRTITRAQSIVEIVRGFGGKAQAFDFSSEGLKGEIADAHIIINTTSVGLYPPDQSLLTDYMDCLHKGQLISDIIYHPRETLLLKQAKMRGCHTLSGAGMLVYQGAEAFRLWTGVEAPVDEMRKVLEEELK
ncbi:MAG: shikimate dehydrogenase, partial [Dehalobacterium sp.]